MAQPASRLAKLVSAALAVLLPVAIVAGSLAGLESFRSFADNREARNAGKVINGRVVEGGVVEMIENTLDQNEPDVIILGNSLSNTDLLPSLLARRLGIGKNKVQKFSIPNSMAAHWYAILKNRVYAKGHHPKLVIILSDMQSALALSPRSEASYLNLSVHLGRKEPVIDEKLGTRNYYLERVRENRGTLRDRALIQARNTMVDLLYHRSIRPTDDRVTEKALSRVFDASRTDMRLHNNVIPIFNVKSDRDLLPFDPAELPMPKDSFIPEITKLVSRNEGRVVFLRPPMSPLLPTGVGDIVLPEAEAKVPKLVDRLGGTYLDLRDLQMDAGHFHNVDHMNPEGARRFTEVLAEVVTDLQLMNPGARRRDQVDLLESIRMVEGRLEHVESQVVFRTAPPALPRADRPFTKARGRMVAYATETMGFLSDSTTLEISPHASRCSPLRVLEDGEPLPRPNRTCEEVLKHAAGRTCHTGDRLLFTATDETSPLDNGRSYSLVLDPGRTCEGTRWLYPGDHLRITLPEDALAAMERGASQLQLSVHDLGGVERDGTDRVQIKVRVNNQPRAEEAYVVAQLLGKGVTVRLEPKIPAAARNVQVDLINESDHYLLIDTARLTEGGRGA